MPDRPGGLDVADAARLQLGRPYGKILDVDADLGDAEPGGPSLDRVPAAQLLQLGAAYGRDLVVEVAEIRQDQPAGDERVHDLGVRRRRPAVESLQQRNVVGLNLVAGEIAGARQVRKRVGDLSRAVLVNLIAVEIGDHGAVRRGGGVQKTVRLDVEAQPQSAALSCGRHDVAARQALEI